MDHFNACESLLNGFDIPRGQVDHVVVGIFTCRKPRFESHGICVPYYLANKTSYAYKILMHIRYGSKTNDVFRLRGVLVYKIRVVRITSSTTKIVYKQDKVVYESKITVYK